MRAFDVRQMKSEDYASQSLFLSTFYDRNFSTKAIETKYVLYLLYILLYYINITPHVLFGSFNQNYAYPRHISRSGEGKKLPKYRFSSNHFVELYRLQIKNIDKTINKRYLKFYLIIDGFQLFTNAECIKAHLKTQTSILLSLLSTYRYLMIPSTAMLFPIISFINWNTKTMKERGYHQTWSLPQELAVCNA